MTPRVIEPGKWYVSVRTYSGGGSFTWVQASEGQTVEGLRTWLGGELLGPFETDGEAIDAGLDAVEPWRQA